MLLVNVIIIQEETQKQVPTVERRTYRPQSEPAFEGWQLQHIPILSVKWTYIHVCFFL